MPPYRVSAVEQPHEREQSQRVRPKYVILGLTFPLVMVLDIVTKRWALTALGPAEQHEILWGLVPLTLAYNKGAAFGLSLGADSRWFFVPVTIIALVLLTVLFRQAGDRDFLRIGSISLVVSGAIGNLYDRVRWDQGVVDFLGPVDLGFWLFPIFNVADMAIRAVPLPWPSPFGSRSRRSAGPGQAARSLLRRSPGPRSPSWKSLRPRRLRHTAL